MTAFVASFNLPSRTRPVVLSYFPGKDAVYDPSYLLLKEPRESWQHVVSDKVVYSLNSREVQGKSLAKVAEDYLKLNLWIECYLTLEACGQTRHVVLAIEFDELASRYWQIGKHENALASVDRDSPVLVNIAHQVELPEQMASEGTGIPSVVRLERFDDRRCPCGYTAGVSVEPLGIRRVENRELGVPGILESQLRKGPDQLVERGSHATEQVPSDEPYVLGRIVEFHSETIPVPLNIILTDNGIRPRFAEGIERVPKRIEVFLRPGCLEVGVCQS